MIHDASRYVGDDSQFPSDRVAEVCPSRYWTADVPFDPAAPVAGDPLAAFINEGRWIVSCPDCNGAQLAALDDPRFMCVDCGNVRNGGAWRPVGFPQALPDIVAALDVRVDPVDVNWLPGQTPDELLAQNLILDTTEVP